MYVYDRRADSNYFIFMIFEIRYDNIQKKFANSRIR